MRTVDVPIHDLHIHYNNSILIGLFRPKLNYPTLNRHEYLRVSLNHERP